MAGNIRAQNALPGDPHWRITHPAHLHQLQGFADHTDVLPGSSFRLFVSTTAPSFRVLAFRMGWYGGDLARLIWTSPPVPGRYQVAAKVVQPGSLVVPPWQPSTTVPTSGWPPGSYLLRLDASTGVQSYVPMVIRSPSVAGRVGVDLGVDLLPGLQRLGRLQPVRRARRRLRRPWSPGYL